MNPELALDHKEAMEYGHRVATKVAGRYDDEYLSAANEATTRALSKFAEDPNGNDPKGLIGMYVRRAVQTVKRGESRRRERHDDIALASASTEDTVALSDLIARLPSPEQSLARNLLVEKKSCRQMAREHGLSPTTMCHLLAFIRRNLMRLYEDSVYARA
jgi:DNA-directed RNA polymerase specialized sigma24 family protein